LVPAQWRRELRDIASTMAVAKKSPRSEGMKGTTMLEERGWLDGPSRQGIFMPRDRRASLRASRTLAFHG